MEEQIQRWAASLGLTPEQVQAGLGSLLLFIQSKAPAPLWQELASRVPQIRSWSSEAITMSYRPAELMSAAAAHAVFPKEGEVTQLLDEMRKAGFTPDRVAQFIPLVLEQLRTRAGDGLVRRLLALPGLGALGAARVGEAGALLGKSPK